MWISGCQLKGSNHRLQLPRQLGIALAAHDRQSRTAGGLIHSLAICSVFRPISSDARDCSVAALAM